jgi:hypothetical protein
VKAGDGESQRADDPCGSHCCGRCSV